MCVLDQKQINGCLERNIFLLKLSTAWPGDISASRWKNSLYICCKIVLGLLTTFCSFGLMWYCFTVHDNLEDVIENIIVLVEIINLAGRAFSFTVYKKELHYLIESIPRNFFVDAACHVNKAQMTLTMSTINFVRKITTGMIVLYMFVAAAMASHPLFVQSEDHSYNSSYSSQKSLIFKTRYPFFKEQNSYYEIQYLCQVITAVFVTSFDVASDITSVALLVYLAFQFQLLNDSVRNMSRNVMLHLKTNTRDLNSTTESLEGLNKTGNIGRRSNVLMGNFPLREKQGHRQYTCANKEYSVESTQIVLGESKTESIQVEIEAEMLRYLKSCIRHHQELLKLSEGMVKLLSPMFFSMFLTSSTLICLFGFELVVKDQSGPSVMRELLHGMVVVLHMWLFCRFGSTLTAQSGDMFNAAYETNWYEYTSQIKHLLRTMIMRASRPVEAKAGLIGTIDLPLFATIIRAAFSYLTLLKQLYEDEHSTLS